MNNCKEFAKEILKVCGLNDECYRGTEINIIENDLIEYYAPDFTFNPVVPNTENYPIHDIAVCLREIGDAVPLPPPKMWMVVWDGDSFIDGMECDSFEEAKNDALDTLIMWQCDQLMEMGVSSYNDWTEAQIEDWDYMIYNWACWVKKRRENVPDDAVEEDKWEEYWWPSNEDYKEIGWLTYDELKEIY